MRIVFVPVVSASNKFEPPVFSIKFCPVTLLIVFVPAPVVFIRFEPTPVFSIRFCPVSVRIVFPPSAVVAVIRFADAVAPEDVIVLLILNRFVVVAVIFNLSPPDAVSTRKLSF